MTRDERSGRVDVMAARIVVLGMHRSGTSAVTRMVNLLGVPVATDLYEGKHNPAGYWESASLIDLNDRLLAAFGARWQDPDLPDGWEHSPTADGLLDEARAAFDAVHGESWVWKDPRLCVTFPFWRRVLGEVPVLVVFRDPAPIARSLEKRQRKEPRPAKRWVALWERYMRSAFDAVAGLPVVAVDYALMVDEPQAAAVGLVASFDKIGVTLTGDPSAAASSIRPELRHDHQPVRLSGSQKRLVRTCSELVGVHDRFEPPELGRR